MYDSKCVRHMHAFACVFEQMEWVGWSIAFLLLYNDIFFFSIFFSANSNQSTCMLETYSDRFSFSASFVGFLSVHVLCSAFERESVLLASHALAANEKKNLNADPQWRSRMSEREATTRKCVWRRGFCWESKTQQRLCCFSQKLWPFRKQHFFFFK